MGAEERTILGRLERAVEAGEHKRDPTIDAGQYAADRLEKLLDEDGFKKWGFVIYLKVW
jgi:hypothetical protein